MTDDNNRDKQAYARAVLDAEWEKLQKQAEEALASDDVVVKNQSRAMNAGLSVEDFLAVSNARGEQVRAITDEVPEPAAPQVQPAPAPAAQAQPVPAQPAPVAPAQAVSAAPAQPVPAQTVSSAAPAVAPAAPAQAVPAAPAQPVPAQPAPAAPAPTPAAPTQPAPAEPMATAVPVAPEAMAAQAAPEMPAAPGRPAGPSGLPTGWDPQAESDPMPSALDDFDFVDSTETLAEERPHYQAPSEQEIRDLINASMMGGSSKRRRRAKEAQEQRMAAAQAAAERPASEQTAPVTASENAGQRTPARTASRSKQKSGLPDGVRLIVKDVFIACLIALAISMVFRPTIVRETSMEPTISPSDYLIMYRMAYRFGDVERGDIVIFQSDLKLDDRHNKLLIKRVIALPGDTLSIHGGLVYVNGTLQNEDYIADGVTEGEVEMVVPQGQVFVMGDHRSVSVDSRALGCIDIDDIVGKAVFRLYPFRDFGMLK